MVLDEIRNIVISIRSELSEEYDVISESSEHFKFRGLCDLSVSNFIDIVKASEFKFDDIYSIHGEQRHSSEIDSCNWMYEHTWCVIIIEGEHIYVDPTSSQFSFIWSDIPEYIVQFEEPRWFLPDMENPSWNGITEKINKFIRIPRIFNINGERILASEGIVDTIQYRLLGWISDNIKNSGG